MKKFAILTSLLALTACGGGSHHPSERVRVSEQPTYEPLYLLTNEDSRLSNSKVTGMVSEIAVCENCDSPRPDTGRKSTGIEHNNKTFTVYNLEDVDFVMADEGFGGEMKFGINENTGEIESFYLLPDEDDPEDEGMSFERAEYNPNEKETAYQFTGKVNHEGHQDAVLTYNSLGKEDGGIGLKYSDFGSFDISVINGWRTAFIGGYDDVKKIDVKNIEEDIDFEGKATGSVVAVLGGEGSGTAIPLDSDASLKFDKKTDKTTMTASFSNWYDVEYTKIGDSEGNVKFTNGKKPDYYLIGDTTGEGKTVSVTGEDLRYFGDNNKPIEAVGLVQVRDCGGEECTNDYDNQQEVRMNLSFGVKMPEK
ncbi:MAG: hypothetical protein IKN73_00420 [Alphaproteobacteria bacterium]|nr:hypothetical protein [Alphaproteobacteria bacterium]